MKVELFILCLIAVSIGVGTIFWLKPVKPEVLPKPAPDDRDSMQRWREICDLEET